jgi:hypothetical protein
MSVGDTSRRYPRIPRGLYEQLLAVEPAVDFELDYRPCRVKLTEGTMHDRVYVQEARRWVEIWGVWPDEDDYTTEIPISEVAEISSSPVRLPAPLAEKMYAAGESGMGYCVFTLVLADGRHIARVTATQLTSSRFQRGSCLTKSSISSLAWENDRRIVTQATTLGASTSSHLSTERGAEPLTPPLRRVVARTSPSLGSGRRGASGGRAGRPHAGSRPSRRHAATRDCRDPLRDRHAEARAR